MDDVRAFTGRSGFLAYSFCFAGSFFAGNEIRRSCLFSGKLRISSRNTKYFYCFWDSPPHSGICLLVAARAARAGDESECFGVPNIAGNGNFFHHHCIVWGNALLLFPLYVISCI